MTPLFAFAGWLMALAALILLGISNLRVRALEDRVQALEQKAKP